MSTYEDEPEDYSDIANQSIRTKILRKLPQVSRDSNVITEGLNYGMVTITPQAHAQAEAQAAAEAMAAIKAKAKAGSERKERRKSKKLEKVDTIIEVDVKRPTCPASPLQKRLERRGKFGLLYVNIFVYGCQCWTVSLSVSLYFFYLSKYMELCSHTSLP